MNEITLNAYVGLSTLISQKVQNWKEAKGPVVVFIVGMVVLAAMGIAYGAYCTFKGLNFEFAFKLDPYTFKIGCRS